MTALLKPRCPGFSLVVNLKFRSSSNMEFVLGAELNRDKKVAENAVDAGPAGQNSWLL
jgi:hypothetical protein